MGQAVETAERLEFERITGTYDAGLPGPQVVVLAGVHGNEPAGVAAQRRVLERLERDRLPLRGRFVALAGNLAALRRGERYLDRDLNRQWLRRQVDRLRQREASTDADEDVEQRDLLRVFDRFVSEAGTAPILFVDLHTSSAEGAPFCCLCDTRPNRRLAMAIPVPVILGLEETIDGAVMEYFNERGTAALAFEGGQHQAEGTVDALEAILWLLLLATGSLAPEDVPDAELYRRLLREASAGAPPVVEVRNHHKIKPGDAFAMRRGFTGFQAVERGDVLARDRDGDIHASEDGRVLLPLYQGLGEDGFFLVRDVPRFWLGVAWWMRALGLRVLLPVLPGVRRHPERPDALQVNPRVARWFVREIFHLLGYRRCRPEEGALVFTRRVVAPATRQLPWRG